MASIITKEEKDKILKAAVANIVRKVQNGDSITREERAILDEASSGVESIDWNLIETDYLNGMQLSQLVEKYGVAYQSLKNRSYTHGWVRKRDSFKEKMQKLLLEKNLANIEEWKKNELATARSFEEKLEDAWDAASEKDTDELFKIVATRVKVHELAKDALGLTDRLDVTSNGKELKPNFVQIIQDCREKLKNGEIDAKTIDVEALKKVKLIE